jgi:hypothetical protein
VKAAVIKDVTDRVILIRMVDGPDLDIPRPDLTPRRIKADSARIRVRNGLAESITVYGGLVLLNGHVSHSQRFDKTWTVDGWSSIDAAPDWVRALWQQAPSGTTEWTMEV